jgi:hypothetical protein
MPFDIAARIEAWRTQLLDTTKRNRLINFKTGRTGGITLVHPDPGELWHHLVVNDAALTFVWQRNLIDLPPEKEPEGENSLTLYEPVEQAPEEASAQDLLERCRRSPRLRPDHLLTDMPDRPLAARLARLALNAKEALTEQGVNTLYVAFGFLRWFESPDSRVEIRSPLLLVPVRLERASVEAPWRLRAEEEDILPNHSLAQLLSNEFRLRLPVPDDTTDPDDPGWRTNYFGEVERCARDHARWEVLDEAALGTFSFQKLAMWQDLGQNSDRITAHALCRAIAGDGDTELRGPADCPTAEELDRTAHAAETFHIRDADSSQHEAIEAAKRGASLVLDGPPGTGKSQTIANVIAEFLAAGKTVLFVSEKAAALIVVQHRLQEAGLGDFCLACHSHKANKRDVVAELGRCLSLPAESVRDVRDDLERLDETRRQVNQYVRELHGVRQPLGLTAFQVHGELARLARLPGTSRCPIPQVLDRDAAYLRRVVEVLSRLPDCRSVFADRDRHPWRGCRAPVYSLTLREDVRHHFSRLAACLGRLAEATTALHQLGFTVARPTRSQGRSSLEAARLVLACPLVPADWFRRDPRPVSEALVQLDDLTRACRRAQAALPEFAPEALRRADPGSLAALSTVPEAPRLVRREGETLQTLRRRLATLGPVLHALQGRALALDQAAQKISELLRTPISPIAVKTLPRLAELAGLVARIGPALQSWWDAGRRKELQGVIGRCQAEALAAQAARAELATRLSPRAFAPESAGLAVQGTRFRSFLMRLLPRWRSLKAEVAGWYPGDLPPTGALLDDLAKVAAYHRRMDYARQVRAQYAADLLAGSDGEPDWDRTLDALQALDRLEQVTKPSPALRAALTSADGLDHSGLVTAGRVLAEQVASLRQSLEGVASEYDLAEVMDGAPANVRLPARDLGTWLGGHWATVSRLAAVVEEVSALLAAGRDLPALLLGPRLHTLVELGKHRTQVAALSGRVWPDQPPREVADRDWSALRGVAEALLRLLDRCGAPLPPAVVRVLTVPDVRARLADAVRGGDAACAEGYEESWRFLAELFDVTQPVSTGLTVEATPLNDLQKWLMERAQDAQRLREWTQFRETEREVKAAGVAPILGEVLGGQVKPEEAGEAFRARFLRLWLDAVYERVPALRQFTTDSHERLIARFRELDRRAIASAAARIRALQLSRPDRPRVVGGRRPGRRNWAPCCAR